MAAPVEQQPVVDEAAQCGGDPVDAVRALIVANGMLEAELSAVYAKASHGFLCGSRLPKPKDSNKS